MPDVSSGHRASPYARIPIRWHFGADGTRQSNTSVAGADEDEAGLENEASPRYAAALRKRRNGFSVAARRPRALRPSR